MRMPSFPEMNFLRVSKGILLLAAVIAACLCPTSAFGQTQVTNVSGGDWSSTAIWSPAVVPNNGGGNTYSVTIDTGPSVALNQSVTINSLVLGSLLTNLSLESPATLDIIGDLTMSGEIDFSSAYGNDDINLTVGGNVINSGTVFAPNFTVGGNVTNSGDMSPSTITVNGTFTNQGAGQFTWFGGSIGSLVNQGYMNVQSKVTLTNQPNGITDVVAGSYLYLASGAAIMAGSNNALANLNSVEGSFLLFNGQATTITPGSGTLTVGNTGSLIVDDTATTLTISGNLDISGSLGNKATGEYAGLGSTLNVTGTFTSEVGADLLVDNLAINAGAMINKGYLTVVNTLSMNGALTNYGSILLKTPAELILGNSSVNSGTITILGSKNDIPSISITGARASVVLTNQKVIGGGGNIGDESMGLINSRAGRIIADLNTPLIIDVSSAGFQNSGTLVVNAKDTLTITGGANSFSNFNVSNGTLTGGTYLVTGTLQFDNANIVTNAANITLSGTTSVIEDQNGNNGLANFATNASGGSFTLNGNRNFTTSGAFNNAGRLTISKGSTFTVGGTNSYTQTAGTTTVSGTLAAAGGVNLSGGSILDSGTINTGSYTQTAGSTTINGSLSLASPSGASVSGGSVFGIGTITGNINLTGGLLSPGSASKKTGELTISGTYRQSGSGAFDVDLGGTTAGTQYDVLDISSTATLGGVLNVDLIGGFKPTVGETFDIMDYTSETGTFTTLNLPKLTGGDSWAISYNATDVALTVDGPGAASASTHEPAAILAKATCFAARLLGSELCGKERIATVANGGEIHAASAGSGEVHNNIMVATRSMSVARGGASHETYESAAAMARMYVCAYLPASVGHTMGCN